MVKKHSHRNFLEPKVTSLNGFFCPTNSPKTNDHLFTIGKKKEKKSDK